MSYVKWNDSVQWNDYVGKRIKHCCTRKDVINSMVAFGSSFRAIDYQLQREYPEETELIE